MKTLRNILFASLAALTIGCERQERAGPNPRDYNNLEGWVGEKRLIDINHDGIVDGIILEGRQEYVLNMIDFYDPAMKKQLSQRYTIRTNAQPMGSTLQARATDILEAEKNFSYLLEVALYEREHPGTK